jgi:hypothetical protein
MTSQTVNGESGVTVYTQGLHLVGDITGDVAITSNSFDTDVISSGYASDAIKLDGTSQSSLGLGTFNPDANGDTINITEGSYGGYATADDQYATVTTSGEITSADYIIA